MKVMLATVVQWGLIIFAFAMISTLVISIVMLIITKFKKRGNNEPS